MEIKREIDILWESTKESKDKKWVAVDDVLEFIEKHKKCSKYHKVKKEDGIYKGTCLYKLFEELNTASNENKKEDGNND